MVVGWIVWVSLIGDFLREMLMLIKDRCARTRRKRCTVCVEWPKQLKPRR